MEDQISSIQRILGTNKKKKVQRKRTNPDAERYIWTVQDELLAIELYIKKATDIDIQLAIYGTSIKLTSMRMKLQNIAFIDTGVGLENVSALTVSLWEESKRKRCL